MTERQTKWFASVESERLVEPARREGWSERLSATVELDGPGAVDGEIARLFRAAAAKG